MGFDYHLLSADSGPVQIRLQELRHSEKRLQRRVLELEQTVLELLEGRKNVENLEKEILKSKMAIDSIEYKLREYKLLIGLRSAGKKHLSPRQRQILSMLHAGKKSSKELSAELGITIRTVKFHITDLLKIFKVTTRGEL